MVSSSKVYEILVHARLHRKDEYYQKTWLPKYMYMYIPCTGFWMAYIFPYQQKNNRRTNWKKVGSDDLM